VARSILITGCSSGIGLRAAEILRERGYRVFASARKLEDVQALQAKGFESIQLDVNDSASIQTAIAEILTRTQGTLDAVCNNAGYGQPGAVEDLTRDALRAQFETNVFGLQEVTNAVIPVMRRQGHGRIIQISSLLGLVPMPYRGAYNASKFAVEALSDTLRLELRGTNIFVSLIEPGPIVSHFRDAALAAYKHSIKIEESAHKNSYQRLTNNIQEVKDNATFTLKPDSVVKKIIDALENKKPKAHYYVTVPTYLLATLKRLLPTCAMDWVLAKIGQSELKQTE
jgi:short-subunit dehydrogenase